MATTAELDLLRTLAERLGPLSTAAPGELILAEHWNTLVGVVGDLARALLAQERDAVPAAHEHLDQVSLGWLEPSLRSLIQGGPLSDPAAEARLADLGRRVARLDSRSDGLNGALGELRSTLDTVSTRDLVREAQLTETRRAVEAHEGTVEDIGTLRKSLAAVKSDVGTAIEIGRKLTVEGQQFDAVALTERVKAVEAVRERLRRPDGELLDASALELRLTELTNTLVTESELDVALGKHRAVIDPEQVGVLEERLRAVAATDGEAAARRVTDDLRGELAQGLAGIDDRIQSVVSDGVGGLREELGQNQRGALERAVDLMREDTQVLVGDRTTALADELRAELQATEARTREFSVTTARELSDAAVASVAGDLVARLDRLDADTTQLLGAQTALSRSLETTATRIEQVAVQEASARQADIAAVREEQSAELSRMDSRMTEVENRRTIDVRGLETLTARLDELESTQDARTRLITEEAVRSLDARVEQIVADRVSTRLADVDATIAETVRLRSAEAQVAIANTLRSDLTTINQRVSALDTRLRRGGGGAPIR